MTRKASLLAGGSRSVAKKLERAQGVVTPSPVIDVSEEALKKRAEDWKTIPQASLRVEYRGRKGRKIFTRIFDFFGLYAKYPHHQKLMNQLLVGAKIVLPEGRSHAIVDSVYVGVPEFIEFLNSERCVHGRNILCVSELDALVFIGFSSYLTTVFPRRTSNVKHFNSIKRIINALRERFGHNPDIGGKVAIPIGPRPTTKPTEGYNYNQMSALIKACVSDIKAIKALHTAYDALTEDSMQLCAGTCVKRRADQLVHEQQFIAALATLKLKFPAYPFYMPFDDIKRMFSTNSHYADGDKSQLIRKISNVQIYSAGKISFMNGRLGRFANFAAMHFVADTIYPFYLLILIKTGWNSEVLNNLSDDLDDYIVDDPFLDPKNYVMILGFKNRSNGVVRSPRCKRNTVFGPYQLLKYIELRIKKYKDSPYYVDGLLFQFSRSFLATEANEAKKLIKNFADRPQLLNFASRYFVKRHQMEALFGQSINHRMVRSGYATLMNRSGNSAQKVGEALDHMDAYDTAETADEYYLSDQATNAQKDEVISKIQNQLLTDLCDYKHRLVESKTLQQLGQAINAAKSQDEREKLIDIAVSETKLAKKTVVCLLSASARTYIVACEDRSNPTWPGHEKYVKSGWCRHFNKCCLCKQSVIFPEALPYVARRIIHLDELQKVLTGSEWMAEYSEEYDSWMDILESWNNKAQVESAWDMARAGLVLLPKMMKGEMQ